MMTSAQVYEMAAKLNESREEVNPVTETNEEVQPEINETNTDISEDKNVSDPTTEQESVEESNNKVEVDDTSSKKNKTPSKKEQTEYAFTKLKNKERQKREKLEARIRELEEINKKYKDLNLESFNGDQAKYTDYLVNQKMNDIEKKKLMEEKRQSQQAEYEAINEQRINNCFPDDNEKAIYNKLLQEHASDFVALLDKADPDGVVLSYLDDSDISPLMIRILMTRPEYRNEILSKTNQYTKMMALTQLENRIKHAREAMNLHKKQTPPPLPKPKMPVIGRVTKGETSSGQIDVNDPSYHNNLLHELNQRRRR